jgi:hypothetical protein
MKLVKLAHQACTEETQGKVYKADQELIRWEQYLG